MKYFNIKTWIDNSMYLLFNVVSGFVFLFSFKNRKLLKQNYKFKNLHSGQKCYIIGTGASLNLLSPEKINQINDNIVFGVNGLYKSDVGQKFKVKYYCLMDNIYFGKESEAFSQVKSSYHDGLSGIITDCRMSESELINDFESKIFLHVHHYPWRRVRCDISKSISSVMNVVSYAIIVAMYMGIKEINLVGCDYNIFCRKGPIYSFYKDDESLKEFNLAYYLKFFYLTTEFHYMINSYAKAFGIKITNVTQDTLLDAYELGEL
jgi:hypothetical protein